ncbi:LPD1 domain-containing protein [Ohessyouella blattaphilus]|uniref:Large polyvalent protein-associated domain-containing protein n=1 Tax=Ohessyouella blattaphilus TaxID=2949333 RepID=A0ABT1EG48_9FIRM|nr:LPD1 domain-containing protein [Ohessyouella blattaphilus]MCP1109685.1 hypothetical protein [Ohessyouella blattaphilus]MCR8563079.1 hypothetical protein [Ohessyouella blattaphilus]
MAKQVQHEDFGEKIGGAKKDLWKERGLLSDDLAGMNGREADKYVKKDNIWRKPDYQAMIDSGMPVDVAFFFKTVRDSLPASPVYLYGDEAPEKRLARQEQYIDTVREVQGIMDSVKTKADVMAAYRRFCLDNGYMEQIAEGMSGTRYGWTEKGQNNPVITNKLVNAFHVSSEYAYQRNFVQKAAKQQFGVSKEDKVPKGYEIRHNDGKNTWSKDDDWKPDTWYVAKGHRIIKTNLATKADALKWVQDFAKQRATSGKKRFVPKQLAAVRRDGPDYRRGRDATGQDYLDTFGFRGGEFGNWMNHNDRQASLNMGFDALKDLAAALKISDRDVSYGGSLSIAFGARGSGNAVAHYEPLRQVINLTKMNGAGSLAHEWWHGLDDHLGGKLGAGGLLSENPRKHPLMAKLIDTIKYKPETPEQAAARAGAQDARTRKNAEGWLQNAMLPALNRAGDDKALAEYEILKTAYLSGEPGSVDKLNDLKKSVTGRVIPKEDRDRLHTFEHILQGMSAPSEPTIGKVPTEFYKSSKRMGEISEKDGGYWDSNVEMMARAFATYVMDALPGRSDYLAGHAECAIAFDSDRDGNLSILKAYPEGDERRAINAVFDEIVAELKLQQYLTHDEHAQAEPPSERQASPRAAPEIGPDPPGEQLSFDSLPRQERPSVMGKLAAAKEAVSKTERPEQAADKPKTKGPEL